jgi:putative membrane protein
VWHDAIAVLLAGIKAGRPADGFVRAIEQCGAVLAQHFPLPAGTVHRPQLPDRLIEI